MTNFKFFALLAITISSIMGCKKSVSPNPYPNSPQEVTAKTSSELLTEKPWRLLSYGFDSNKNGVVDNNEESIRDCDKDNTYIFNENGSGVVNENSLICNGNNPVNQFTWTLTNNDTVLDFYYGKAYVLQLTKEKMSIASSNFDEVKLLLVYGH